MMLMNLLYVKLQKTKQSKVLGQKNYLTAVKLKAKYKTP